MKPKWQKLASLAHDICTLQFQFFGAVFASKGYPSKNIFENHCTRITHSSCCGCSQRVHIIVYLAVKKGNILVNILLLKCSLRIIVTYKSSWLSAFIFLWVW